MENSPVAEGREKERDRRGRGARGSRFSDADASSATGGVNRDRSRERRNCRIYISNIPYDYRWQDLKDLFRRVVGSVEYVELFHDENGKARGCGIVEFTDPDNVEKALEKMNRYEVNGRELAVKEDHGEQRDQCGRIIRDGSGGGGGGGMAVGRGGGGGNGGGFRGDGGFGGGRRDDDRSSDRNNYNMMSNDFVNQPANYNYGLSASFLENLGNTGPLHNKVFVANHDYKVDSKKLKQVFKLAGKVQSVDLSLDKDGNSRGCTSCLDSWQQQHDQYSLCRRPDLQYERIFLTESTGAGSDNEAGNAIAANLAREREERRVERAETERLRRRIDEMVEQNNITTAAHDLHVSELLFDINYWKENFMRVNQEVIELRKRQREAEALRQAKERAEEQSERRGRRNEQLKAIHRGLLNAIREQEKASNNAWGRCRLSIRNFPSAAAADPKQEVLAILTRLSIPFEPTAVKVMSCTEMITEQSMYQILVEFADTRLKLELLAKFGRLADHQNPRLRALQVSDCIAVKELFKKANTQLRGDAFPTEITSESQLEEFAQRLDSLPPKPKNKRRKKLPTIDVHTSPTSD